MSADSYGYCARCFSVADREHAIACNHLEESYGRISSTDYVKAVAAMEEAPQFDDEQFLTIREYREFLWESSGVLRVRYSGYCDTCQYGFEFKRAFDVPFDDSVTSRELEEVGP